MNSDNSSLRILIVDDEPDIIEVVKYNLLQQNYLVSTATDGIEAIQIAKKTNPHLILLDINMPNKDGVAVVKELRNQSQFADTIIIFLTALASEQNEVEGLNIGADDYIVKPIKPQVLISRIKSALRRFAVKDENLIVYKDLVINKTQYNIKYQNETINLARKEFELLCLLASKPTKVFERLEILNTIWGQEVIVGDRTIDVHIRKIRQKLNDNYISTVKGVGYKFEM
jgi:two-component system, OmpR family, alkaline phosphatase synthesis response regulator PhoP